MNQLANPVLLLFSYVLHTIASIWVQKWSWFTFVLKYHTNILQFRSLNLKIGMKMVEFSLFHFLQRVLIPSDLPLNAICFLSLYDDSSNLRRFFIFFPFWKWNYDVCVFECFSSVIGKCQNLLWWKMSPTKKCPPIPLSKLF